MDNHIQNGIVDLSVIIPIFNQKDQIEYTIKHVVSEITGSVTAEILLIDDGSTDGSGDICKTLAEKYSQIRYFYQENGGVSSARNRGIRNAKGTYLFYLDADDTLEKGTLCKIKNFFDSVYDEVDLVTYKIDTIYKGKLLKPHFRYQFLRKSDVYDLREHAYIGQTTMNIVVKNKFEDNVLFDEQQTFSEDQKYCCDILKDKLKMGYCAEGRYLYYRSENSSSGKLSGACYIFEQCTRLFEELFEDYEEVPVAFQGLFVNDFFWKQACNILYPYHYEGEEYEAAMGRLKKLLSKCSAETILYHPQIDFFEKYYMLRLKNPKELECRADDSGFGLFRGNTCMVYENSVEIVMTKCQVRGDKVYLRGFLKSVFFQFYEQMPMLCAIENCGKLTRKLPLRESAHDYYLSHEKTQKFWAFTYECDIHEVTELAFEMEVRGKWFPVHYYFMPCVPFSHKYKRYSYTNNGIKISIDKKNHIHIQKMGKKVSKAAWLYYDCVGVACDNGMLQFLHDYEKNDGVERYYVVSDEKQKSLLPDKNCFVVWGSSKHKKLFKSCQRILTAYIEEDNLIPFEREDYDKYAGDFHFEVVYLQHGVLHIDMPWKYSPEKILADRVVVSTKQEAELFCRNGFCEEDLISCRMPRFSERAKGNAKSRKILFAPSWRSYLVGNYVDHKWTKLEGKFLSSMFYNQVQQLLNSEKLMQFLEENDYTMDVKLHPIFAMYRDCIKLPESARQESSRIRMTDTPDAPQNYEIFITDISSYAYDYMFQGIPVFWFLPDVTEFKSGMNGYRDMGVRDYWQKVSTDSEELVAKLWAYVQDGVYDGLDAEFYENGSPTEYIYQKEIKR